MKNVIAILIFLNCSILFAQSPAKRVLFLGNSYTSTNDLPQMIADMAASTGNTLIFESNAPGGYYLGNHVTDSISLNKIKAGNWDYMVMQDQSLSYAYPSTFMNMIPAAHILDSIRNVYSHCGQTMFYITWGRKNGDTYLCTPPECNTTTWINRSYYEMDSTIQLNYMFVTDSLRALASPVGAVWRYIRRNYTAIELFQSDESHPSQAGTFAAACCFYVALFRKDPTLISFNSGLTNIDAANIKTASKEVVYKRLLDWHIGKYDSLISIICSVPDTTVQDQHSLWQIYPNPVTSTLTIRFKDTNGKAQIQIYNAIGMLVKEMVISANTQINIADLPNGFYFIRPKNYKQPVLKFIKQ